MTLDFQHMVNMDRDNALASPGRTLTSPELVLGNRRPSPSLQPSENHVTQYQPPEDGVELQDYYSPHVLDESHHNSAEQLPDAPPSYRPSIASGAPPAPSAFRSSTHFKPLERRIFALCLFAIYATLSVLAWTLTAILSYRTIQGVSYTDQQGQLSIAQYNREDKWRRAVKVLTAIVSTMTLPVVSSICARAAVVFFQNGRTGKLVKNATMRQTMAMADQGWADIKILLRALRYNYGGPRVRSLPLMFSAAVYGISCLIYPLYGLLVDAVQVDVLPYDVAINTGAASIPAYAVSDVLLLQDPFTGIVPDTLAVEGTAALIANSSLEHVAARFIDSSSGVNPTTSQERLWWEPDTTETSNEPLTIGGNSSIQSLIYSQGTAENWFVSSIPSSQNTGVLRQLSLRRNTSVSCESTGMPESCSGTNPYTVDSTFNLTDETGKPQSSILHICVPGDITKSSFTNTTNAQTITENVYMSFNVTGSNTALSSGDDISEGPVVAALTCTYTTTMGYFELPNSRNNNKAGPLMSAIPSREELRQSWNDPFNSSYSTLCVEPVANSIEPIQPCSPKEYDEFLKFRPSYPGPGPLLTTMFSLFGNDSFYALATLSKNASLNASDGRCFPQNIPYAQISTFVASLNRTGLTVPQSTCGPAGSQPPLVSWLRALVSQPSFATTYLHTLSFFANQAALLDAGGSTWAVPFDPLSQPRVIRTYTGLTIYKPTIHNLGAVIALSILIALQLLGLFILAMVSVSEPTWTSKLDSWAMIRMAGQLKGNLPRIANRDSQPWKFLDMVHGWVGAKFEPRDELVQDQKTRQDISLQNRPLGTSCMAVSQLALGGSFPIGGGARYLTHGLDL